MCLSVLAYLKKPTLKCHEISVDVTFAMARSSSDENVIKLWTSRFVNDVMFSHNGHIICIIQAINTINRVWLWNKA